MARVTTVAEAATAASVTAAGQAGDGGAPVAAPPHRLHVPDEPAGRREAWRAAVLGGQDLAEVVAGPGGVVRWLWARWSVLGSVGMDEAAVAAVATDYRRELWLWLAGDRAWQQCCSGLIGRISRRIPS